MSPLVLCLVRNQISFNFPVKRIHTQPRPYTYLIMDPTNVAANVAAMPAYQVSILDVFFPGLTGIFAMANGLSTGKLNGYARLLLFGGFCIFLAKYAYGYINDLVNSYCS